MYITGMPCILRLSYFPNILTSYSVSHLSSQDSCEVDGVDVTLVSHREESGSLLTILWEIRNYE